MEKNFSIERGTIIAVGTSGYRIASLDREGIETPEIGTINESSTYSVGDKVYFFYFTDGTGKIICPL